jgi:hypothetical protein
MTRKILFWIWITFLLNSELPQKMIPYYNIEWKYVQYIVLKVIISLRKYTGMITWKDIIFWVLFYLYVLSNSCDHLNPVQGISIYKNSCMFPDGALYIHPSIIFVDLDFTFTEHIYNIYPYRFAFGLLLGIYTFFCC